MKKTLEFISKEMKEAGVEYHFLKNKKSKPTYPYFVGELLPVDPVHEDGMKEYTLILDGFSRSTLEELLETAEKIESHFPDIGGRTALLGNQVIAVFFCTCQPIEMEDEKLQKVEITLTVKTWKGN